MAGARFFFRARSDTRTSARPRRSAVPGSSLQTVLTYPSLALRVIRRNTFPNRWLTLTVGFILRAPASSYRAFLHVRMTLSAKAAHGSHCTSPPTHPPRSPSGGGARQDVQSEPASPPLVLGDKCGRGWVIFRYWPSIAPAATRHCGAWPFPLPRFAGSTPQGLVGPDRAATTPDESYAVEVPDFLLRSA
jgi:hypothetical protein